MAQEVSLLVSGKSFGTVDAGVWLYGAWLAWFLSVALVMFLTTERWLSGAVAFWLMAALAVAAGMLSTVLLVSSARFAHWLILVPMWAFGVRYNITSVWLPPYILFTCFLYLGSLMLTAVGVAVWDWARRRRGA